MLKPLKFFTQCKKTALSTFPGEVILLQSSGPHDSLLAELAHKIPEHYVDEEFLEHILRKWKKKKTASYLAQKLPKTQRAKSGDLGEILLKEYIDSEFAPYEVPVRRLNWKDHTDFPMRGEDALGFDFTAKPIRFLKAESKSYKRLTDKAVGLAREMLEKNAGLPLPHTLCFIMERLFAVGQNDKANKIGEYVDLKIPDRTQVAHMIFTFSENDPSTLLQDDIKKIKKGTHQRSVGVHVEKHQELIRSAFEIK